jgi:D-serine deaminase-like pyridoxal phosphate-dependent protein
MDRTQIEDLDTPCLVVDLRLFEANVALCMERLAGVDVRPHLKTAKSPAVARLLLEAGAVGVCVAKLGEAEVMLEGGIDDVMVTTELVGPAKLRRLAELRERWPEASIRVVVDSWEGASRLNAALAEPIETLIEVNVAQNRCGVAPPAAVGLADRLVELDKLELVGLQGYEGNLQHIRDRDERRWRCDRAMQRLARAVDDLLEAGHRVDVVTTGGTGTAEFCAEHEMVTEVQPGSFAFMDADYRDTHGVPYEHALTTVATVISHPTANRAMVDAGLKTLSNDSGPARVIDAPGWTYEHAGDEHGALIAGAMADRRDLEVGDRVTLVPSHIDTTLNLHDTMYVQRDGEVLAEWAIAARGKVR